ncbi:class A beta-lactamase [Nonomuraea rhodomycinica]|uniref:Beta-lactamase n=1 Tax=Nonomuraea rhodomycinica TaxID=1712872 RepID=A0A7Y6IYM6_9ACTN|nr:class A beta-lactamase [Nonomuraea rhodomycinica]NUW46792.1 class A beta-lactamase [Nonomuraea rhodomycinica]
MRRPAFPQLRRLGRAAAALPAAALAISLLSGGTPGTAAAATAVPAAAVAVPGEAQVRKELRALESAFQGRIGAYAVDTATGRTLAYRANERFALLSTFKAPLCAAVLHKARTSEPGLMGKLVTWTADDLTPGSPITEKHVADGLTVAQLCAAATSVSDGTASNLLLKQIGGPAGLTAYFRSLKDPLSRMDRWHPALNDWTPKDRRDTTTPAAIAADLRVLALGDALHREDRKQFVDWLLANKTGANRIRAGLPKTWTIGDRTGTNSDGFGGGNAIAVIWPGKDAAPIVMAVYTNRTPGLPIDEKTIAKTATVLARGLGKL